VLYPVSVSVSVLPCWQQLLRNRQMNRPMIWRFEIIFLWNLVEASSATGESGASTDTSVSVADMEV